MGRTVGGALEGATNEWDECQRDETPQLLRDLVARARLVGAGCDGLSTIVEVYVLSDLVAFSIVGGLEDNQNLGAETFRDFELDFNYTVSFLRSEGLFSLNTGGLAIAVVDELTLDGVLLTRNEVGVLNLIDDLAIVDDLV